MHVTSGQSREAGATPSMEDSVLAGHQLHLRGSAVELGVATKLLRTSGILTPVLRGIRCWIPQKDSSSVAEN